MDGPTPLAFITNGTVGEVVREEKDHALVVDWPEHHRTVVPQHWYEPFDDLKAGRE